MTTGAESVGILTAAAQRVGMTAAQVRAFLADMWVESRWNSSAVGDNGSSFGFGQNHVGGAGGPTLASARRFLDPTLSANDRAAAFQKAGVVDGAGAAKVQRPADPAGYATRVNQAIRNLPSLLASSAANGAASAINTAHDYLGTPYLYGGSSPTTGFDCSGLVQYAFAKAGITLPRTSQQQAAATQLITKDQASPGDLVFFDNNSHVGIYAGNGQMIDAPHTGSKVKLENVWAGATYRRVPGAGTGNTASSSSSNTGSSSSRDSVNQTVGFGGAAGAISDSVRHYGLLLLFVLGGLTLIAIGSTRALGAFGAPTPTPGATP